MRCFLIPVLFTIATQSAAAQSPDSIDATAKRLMATENVQGLALAYIVDGQVQHVGAYGWRNVERQLPLTSSTVMYGASLTKAAVAYLVLQLVDERRLSLDATPPQLLPKPLPAYEEFTDVSGDDRWQRLTPRVLLSHSTGFANFRWLESDQKLRFHGEPGVRYGYSGEGFYVLQLLLEEGLDIELGEAMQSRVFSRFGMTHTSMQWRPDFAENLADGYRADGTVEPHDERSRPSAAGSMDTSIEDQARLWAAIVRGDGLSAASRREFSSPQLPITSRHQFPTLTAPDEPLNADISLSAGLGVVTYVYQGRRVWFKGGHNDSTGNMVICLDDARTCLVLMANDVRAERIYPALVEAVLGDIGMPWRWEYDWYRR